MSKIIIANWRKKEEGLGGQESFFDALSKTLNAKIISFASANKVLNLFEQTDTFMRGYTIDNYLKRYEDLFNLDLIIKNSGIGGFVKLKTPQVVIFQDPFYSILTKMINDGFFSGCDFYLTLTDLQKRTAKNAIKTVAISNFMKEDMRLCGIKCDKIIEHGIDTEKFKPVKDKEKLKKMHNLPTDKKIGIAVTKFLHQKGWGILSELINKFPEIHWIVILTEKVGSKPKLKNVSLVECVSPEVMPHFYNVADFYISTSPVEGNSLAILEAASCNLPIITYKTGIAWDWWDKRLGIRVDDWTVEAFEKAISTYVNQSQPKSNSVVIGYYEPRKTIIERGFTKERMAKQWKDYVEKIINK